MFQIGEKVVCGSKGVCRVENITTLNISGIDKQRVYYILKPLYMAASTVYVPADHAMEAMRPVLSEDAARDLVERIPQLTLIHVENEKLLEQEYKACLRTDSCAEWLRIIKTTRARKERRQEAGRKMTAVDARYLKIAQDCVYGELAVALSVPREKVEEFVEEQMGALVR